MVIAGAGAALGLGAVFDWVGWPAAAVVAFLVAIGVTIVGPARRAYAAIQRRILDINTLMVIAVVGAGILGEWFEAAAVVWLFAVAQQLEVLSMDRARHAIRRLMTLAADTATVRRDGTDLVVRTEEVRAGDLVILRPGERLAVDGVVRAGLSAVDQAPVTGESWPVEKTPGAAVFAGTINGSGALEIEATRRAADSTLARIVRLVEQAQRQRAPVQTFVERFARWYTPAVVGVALAVAIVPPLALGGLAGWTSLAGVWTYRALALLVVACPCALVISTPVSVVSALTAAARAGVLIKGGAHLERLAGVRCVALDKTGTLTEGRVTVTDVVGLDGVSPHGVLGVAAALESRSEHPIGRAIVSHARLVGLTVQPGDGFRALPGFGAEAMVAAAPALIGSHRLFEERQLCTPALHDRLDEVERRGVTPVLVGHDGAPLGLIGLSDTLRADGSNAVAALRRAGVTHIALLTGDSRLNAERVRRETAVDEVRADLLPDAKVGEVRRLQQAHGVVAMVGDGINDAPALAAADVGVAMGVAGSDVALETADVALMADDLSKLPFAIRLGRRTLGNIRQNVALALGLKLAFVALAAAGVATIWMAVLADTGASLLVTANGLRLLRE
jgi:Cd2+/Zn2+-exporting ATPase